jgi:hypothetical protein
MVTMALPSDYTEAYPPKLWEGERELLATRRGRSLDGAQRPPDDIVGVALSGGGIRSATFCLGVFQALAHFRLLSKVDYLSTVSGGGYFGAFLGRLFSRAEVTTTADVEELLSAAPGGTGKPAKGALLDVVGWLRENGRYLSPNGAGDLLLGGAAFLRNWVAMQIVLLTFLVMLFLTGQIVRAGLDVWAPGWWGDYLRLLERLPWGQGVMWWSPYIGVWLIPFVFWAIPAGWAYWMIGRIARRGRFFESPWFGLAAATGLTLLVGVTTYGASGRALAGLLLGVEALTAIVWAAAYADAVRRAKDPKAQALFDEAGDPARAKRAEQIFRDDESRHSLSAWLKTALVVTVATLVFALVDSLGQMAYLAAVSKTGPHLSAWAASILSALTALAGFGRKITVLFGGRDGDKRPGMPLSIVATAVALLIAGLLLTLTDAASHAVAWNFHMPASAPESWRADVGAVELFSRAEVQDLCILAGVWLITVFFSFAFGWCWPFLNGSSQQSLYSARLTRAYLGASNPLRVDPANQQITRVLPGDNTDLASYYPPAGAWTPAKARPLHLINVTINETVNGKSQIEQRDRKGVGLAIGPRAFSAGVRHHAVFQDHTDRARAVADIFPSDRTPVPHGRFQMFKGWSGGEVLSLGYWVGISGAAFSTGIGARTNLGLSLLCGLSNVRLGYWWDSRVEPAERAQWSPPTAQRFEAFVTRWIFPVQSYFLNEFLARFPGSARRRWYLSDGGHFENLGGYELIRRRLKRMVVVDAEADPDYTFEGLANLVRKARLDFGAEITFLGVTELDRIVDPHFRPLFGTLEQLRRGKRSKDSTKGELDTVDLERVSAAHAALARVMYQDEPSRVSWLVYVKPTLTGDEPADITQYHATHPSFPQEPTADQFFDEAQWESYRRLGFEIGSNLFQDRPATLPPQQPGATFIPRGLLAGSWSEAK